MAKILISAGEASGDIHAAAVTAALKKIDSTVEVFGMGGDELRAAGGEVLFDIKDHGVMALWRLSKSCPTCLSCVAILLASWMSVSRTAWW